jgi:hypothetical protein
MYDTRNSSLGKRDLPLTMSAIVEPTPRQKKTRSVSLRLTSLPGGRVAQIIAAAGADSPIRAGAEAAACTLNANGACRHARLSYPQSRMRPS